MPANDSPPDLGRTFCDVVMKGGITSGVVYPTAIAGLAQRYRLRNIGGASAGAWTVIQTRWVWPAFNSNGKVSLSGSG